MAFPGATGIDRRTFLKVSAISGVGFAIACLPYKGGASQPDNLPFGDFVRVARDNTVTVVIKHLDKGQGITTGLTAIVAEELDADWQQMRWEFAPTDVERYNNLFWGPVQGTGGSTSLANSWTQLRRAGAAARSMLVGAAARNWQVPAAEITVDKGMLAHPSGRKASFGDMAELAAVETPPAEPTLKTPDQFSLIGSDIPRIDSAEKSSGRAMYTADVRRPGMLYAVMVHPPRFGARLKSMDASATRKLPGVKEVVETARGVGIVADSFWVADQARQSLKLEWDDSNAETRSSTELWAYFRSLADTQGRAVSNKGDIAAAEDAANRSIELEFQFPYLAHATMEPLNCVVELGAESCHIWTAAQAPSLDVQLVAQVTGIAPAQVVIHTQFAGGSFGRRAVPDSDYIVEAAMIARALQRPAPISLQWSREDDMQAGRYRPMTLHRLRAGIDDKAGIISWRHMVVGQPVYRDTPFESMISGPVDNTITEGGSKLPYAIPNMRMEAHEARAGVPVLWWRSVGHSHNAYATEVFIDELAIALNRDPLQLRSELLKEHPRHLAVLKLAADKAGWGKKLPAGRAQGLSVHESFNTFVAQIAEVTLAEDGSYSVDRVVCAVDCGIAVTPDVIRAQMEGGIGFGLSSITRESISLKNGLVEQDNYPNYRPLRIDEMPRIEVHIMPSNEPPTGVGEPGTPPIGPAVANALRRLTGTPITRLPIGARVSLT